MKSIDVEREIFVTSGIGEASTKLAAFDAALLDAKIANFNLIKLSSVIPPNSKIIISRPSIQTPHSFGKRLYVVLAEAGESEKGREAWAGIGWVQTKDGRGLFVEQHGSQQAEVMRLIKETLKDMVDSRDEQFGDAHYQVVGVRCENEPVCAIVAAVYEIQGWQDLLTN